MARPREFDIDQAIDDAMRVFWEKGYQGANLPDLLAGMGIARGSFYKAFGSKKALFLRALDRYAAAYIAPAVAMLSSRSRPGIERIRMLFDGGLQRVRDGDFKGCLLCNSAAAANLRDEDIRQRVHAQLEELCGGFAAALADHYGANPASVVEKARELTMDYVGLRILARGAVGRAMLEDAVASRLQALEV